MAAADEEDADLLASLPFFRNMHYALVKRLVNSMRLAHFAPGDIILNEGDLGEEMVFIARGKVELIARSRRLSVLTEGAFIGESCMLGMQSVLPATARALSYCDVYRLRAEDMSRLLEADREHGASVDLNAPRLHEASLP